MISDEIKLLQKLEKCKKMLWSMNLKKSGRNNYHNYDYYELEDITVPIHTVLNQQGLISNFKVSEDRTGLNLNIYDTETGYKDVTYCPFSEKEKAGMKGVQELQTYAKRTLFLLVFELQEPNVIEIENGAKKQEKIKKPQINKIIQKALTTCKGKKQTVTKHNLWTIIKGYKLDTNELHDVCSELKKRDDIP